MKALYRPRWPLLVALIAGVAVLLALVYVPARHSGQARPTRHAGYIEGVAGAPATVNPLFAGLNQADADLSSLIFAGLVRLGHDGSVEAGLADLPRVTPEGSTYIFQLRSGLTWQDGAPLTARDVAFTISLIQDPAFQGDPTLRDVFRGVQVEARDDRTVTMTLPAPFAPFLARLAGVGILPRHLLGDVPAGDLANAAFNKLPIGSGPFRLIELSPERALLQSFAGYYLGQPHLESLQLRFYRDDSAVLKALRNGDVDGAFFRQPLAAGDLASLVDDSRWVTLPLHGTTYSLVYLNQQRALPLADGRVRQALQHALDRQALIDKALDGQALSQDGPIARDLWAYAAAPPAYRYDAKTASDLLDSAGWTLQNGARTRDGAPLQFTLSTSDDPLQMRVAQEIARQWEKLGIRAEVQSSAGGQFVENVLLPRNFEAALVSIDPGPDPDPYPFWHSTQTFGNGRNLSGFIDATVDRLVEDGRQTTAVSERLSDYRSFQGIYAAQLPGLPLYTPTYQYIVSSDVKGLNAGLLLTPSSRFADVHAWYLPGTSGSNG